MYDCKLFLVIQKEVAFMPVGFTDGERKIISTKLRQAALECLQRYGVRQTTVEQLTDKAGISKGAFYSFYGTKEHLMFEVLDETRRSIQVELGDRLKAAGHNTEKISSALFDMCMATKSSIIIDIVKNRELDYLERKLPENDVRKSFDVNMKFIGEYFSGSLCDGISTATVVTAMAMLYSMMMHMELYQPEEFEPALKLLIDAFVNQIIKK